MKKPTVLGIYGKTDSGKTSLVVELVEKLSSKGFNIATIKKSNKTQGIDTENKDTHRHARAGSNLVVFSSPIETDFLFKKEMNEKQIIQKISMFDDFDVILVEGPKDKDIPKIKIGDIDERENTIMYFKNNFEEILNYLIEKIGENK